MHFTKHIKDEHTEFGNDSFLQFYYRESASMVYYGLLIMSLACQPCFSFHNTIAHSPACALDKSYGLLIMLLVCQP
ncbi:MAG: hypothetical protein WBB55_12530 [Anaerolineales bacterium]